MKYLLDSAIVIDHFNGINSATTVLKEQGNECVLSAISRDFQPGGDPEVLIPYRR